jgi:nucleoside-diphosphate-sugar epimerase
MESKVIIVTGASRGIGFAVAQSLLAASHKVVLVSRSGNQLQELKERYPAQVAFLAADMTVADVSRRGLPPSFQLEVPIAWPPFHDDSIGTPGVRTDFQRPHGK